MMYFNVKMTMQNSKYKDVMILHPSAWMWDVIRHAHLRFLSSIHSNHHSNSRKSIKSSVTVNVNYEILSTRQNRKYKIKLEAKSSDT